MGKSSGGIRKSKANPKNGNLNRTVSGLAKGITLQNVLDSLSKDKIALKNINKKIEELRSEYNPDDKFFKEITKETIESYEVLKNSLENDIKFKSDFLKKNKVRI